MQTSVYQANRNQLLLMSASIFVSVTAAVIVSTLLVMSLMKGEIASALNSTVNNSPQTSQVASTCAVPQGEQAQAQAAMYDENSSVVPTMHTASAPMHYAHYSHYNGHYKSAPVAHNVSNSYNSSNVSNTTTTNNIKNTELHKTTVIKDSFNKDSYNDNSKGSHNTVVVKDNTVNLNSNNTTNTNSNNTKTVENTVVVKDNTVNYQSNHTTNNTTNTTSNSHNTANINSNNTVETHLLSDNKVVVPVVVTPAPLPTV